jgi:CRP-like cAMP-binding protein
MMPRSPDWPSLEKLSPLLAALPGHMRRNVRTCVLAKAARLFSRGDRPKAMYFVVSGEIHLVRPSLAGNDIVVQRTRGGFLAKASLDQAAYHCDAVAIQSTEVLLVPRQAFNIALQDEQFRTCWISQLTRELRRVRAQAERLSLKTAPERIIHYIETEGEKGSLTLRHSKKDWATELGLTHEALYRALSRMEHGKQLIVNGATLSIRS